VLAALGFLGVVLITVTVVHLYLWLRLVRNTTARHSRARRLGGLAIIGLAVLIPATMITTRNGHAWAAWGYLWLAMMFYLLVALILLELPRLVATLWLRRTAHETGRAPARVAAGEPALVAADEPARIVAADEPVLVPGVPAARAGGSGGDPDVRADGGVAGTEKPGRDHDPDRRLLLARGAAIFAGLTAAGVTGYGVRTAYSAPRVARVTVPLAKLPRSMDGFSIATVSDIHLGPLAGRPHAERVVAAINRLDADLVAVVGDLVDGSVEELGAAAAPLRDISSRHGTFFVTGNHEYYSGVEQWLAEVPRLGMRVLANERVAIDGLDLAGVHDLAGDPASAGGPVGDLPAGLGPDFDAALGGRDPARPVVLLSHQPVQAFEAARHGVDLQLSGHTHGGQMVPFNLLVKLQQPVVSGLGEIDGTKVYVTNGAGFWGPPVRVGVPPQVSLVRLRTA
jgi:predicted MPP superfamily phosphohydrolase